MSAKNIFQLFLLTEKQPKCYLFILDQMSAMAKMLLQFSLHPLFPVGKGVLNEMQNFVGVFCFPREMTAPEKKEKPSTWGFGF